MDTRVVFATSHDGVRVACSVRGNGFPLLLLHGPLYSNCRGNTNDQDSARFQERLASRRAFTMVDVRGCGLADRGSVQHSFENYMIDLLAIYHALGIQQADILAFTGRPSLAVRFAGCYPEHVRRLYLWA